jgi:hypothetical protein
MALSEHERKVLEELERGLYESDSNFATRMGGSQQKLASAGTASPKRMIAGGAVVLIGLTEILAALVMRYPMFAVLGFALMVLGLSMATGQFGRKARLAKAGLRGRNPKSSRAAASSNRGISTKFEERWDRRAGE